MDGALGKSPSHPPSQRAYPKDLLRRRGEPRSVSELRYGPHGDGMAGSGFVGIIHLRDLFVLRCCEHIPSSTHRSRRSNTTMTIIESRMRILTAHPPPLDLRMGLPCIEARSQRRFSASEAHKLCLVRCTMPVENPDGSSRIQRRKVSAWSHSPAHC